MAAYEALDAVARERAGDPGPVVLRRLSNAEYTYTVQDLTGVDSLQPAREFPVDGAAGEGFMNTGQALVMSASLLTKYLDAGSTELLRACWGGQQFKQVLLTCYRSDGAKDNKPVQYLKVDMQHVIVANYSVSGGPGDVPVENVSLDYGVIQYTYAEQKHEDGKTGSNLPATHNLETRVIS